MTTTLQSFASLPAACWSIVVRAYRALSGRRAPEIIPAPVEAVLAEVPALPSRKASRPQEAEGVRWHFRGAILDRLDDYFSCARRLKKHDRDAYDLFSRVGLGVTTHIYKMSRITGTDRIMHGGVAFSGNVDDKNIYPSFTYFRKFAAPPFGVEFSGGGAIYKVTCVYDERGRHKKLVVPMDFWVSVDGDGRPHLLREYSRSTQQIMPKKKRASFGGHVHVLKQPFVVYRNEWKLPSWLNLVKGPETKEEKAAEIFSQAYESYRESAADILISVKTADCAATFGIGIKRAPYFFADREGELTPSGSKKKIFHGVREHERQVSPDKKVTVKAHYRGMRHFDWNGYSIAISFPGVNEAMLLKSGPGGYDEDTILPDELSGFADSSRVGEIIAARLTA